MLIFDFSTIGNKLFSFRKRMGMTQAEVAEAAGLSDRTYADIERGSVNIVDSTLSQISLSAIRQIQIATILKCQGIVKFREHFFHLKILQKN